VVAAIGIAGPAERVLRPGLDQMARATAAAITASLRASHNIDLPPLPGVGSLSLV
jgi:hypothetical protein